MKKITVLKSVILALALFIGISQSQAQLFPNTYINVDWQMNSHMGQKFANKASGWGMNFESGYFVSPAITIGPFISYHTNTESVARKTLDLGNGAAMTTNQIHSLFQLPFGLAARYNWLTESLFQPYVGMKIGAQFAQMSSYYYVVKHSTDTWGFYMSPEFGVSIFPNPSYRMGFHVALYYSFATNRGDILIYDVNKINNLGLRVGVSF